MQQLMQRQKPLLKQRQQLSFSSVQMRLVRTQQQKQLVQKPWLRPML
jgi:hypothetical protein